MRSEFDNLLRGGLLGDRERLGDLDLLLLTLSRVTFVLSLDLDLLDLSFDFERLGLSLERERLLVLSLDLDLLERRVLSLERERREDFLFSGVLDFLDNSLSRDLDLFLDLLKHSII